MANWIEGVQRRKNERMRKKEVEDDKATGDQAQEKLVGCIEAAGLRVLRLEGDQARALRGMWYL